MKKRIVSLLVCLVMVLTLFPVTVFATEIVDSGYCGGEGDGTNLTWTLDDEGTLTISGSGKMDDWRSEGTPWYDYMGMVKHCVIENGVTSIGDHAFYLYCPFSCYNNLSSITIPNSVTSIGNYAFYDCENLLSVNIPDSVKSIGIKAFFNCVSLESVTIPKNVSSIGKESFTACSSLKSIDVDSSNEAYKSESGVVYSKDGKTILAYPNGKSGAYVIPSGVISIGKYAFNCSTNLTAVTIPSSVKSIGDGAFGDCKNLTEINIPNSVYWIGDEAFMWCSSLKSITIPNSVDWIGKMAFYSCEMLSKIIIPNSISYLNYETFGNCKNLASVTIPNSVKSIDDATFSECKKLTSVTIPDSVTSIGSEAFFYCSSLVSIRIPNGVTSIGSATFEYCSSLSSVIIPESVNSIHYSAFAKCDSLSDIYFRGSKEQWNAFGIDDLLSNVQVHCNSKIKSIDGIDVIVPPNQYCIHVVDEDGNPLPDATVELEDASGHYIDVSDQDGNAFFDLVTFGTSVITMTKDGFSAWSNQNSNWQKSDKHYSIVTLYSSKYDGFKLASARYSNSADMSHTLDLLTNTKKLSLKNDGHMIGDLDFGNFYIDCTATNTTKVKEYQLYQNSTKVAVSDSGSFGKLSVRQFSKGGGCFIRVVTTDGKAVDTNVNLEFAANKAVKATELSLKSNKISFTVGEDVPFVGGQKMEFDLPINSPVTVLTSEDKIQIGLNVNLANGANEKEQLDKVKDLIKKAYLAQDISLKSFNPQDVYIFETLVAEKNEAKLFGKKPEVNFLGYAEADIGSSVAKGQIMLQIKLDVGSMEYNTWVIAVPVTVQIKLSLSGGVLAEVSYDWANATITGDVDAELKPKLTAFVGAGASKIIGVGAYGEAECAIKLHIIAAPVYFKNIDLTGELGLKAYVGPVTYERPFAHNTWHLKTGNNVLSTNREPLHAASWNEGIYDAENYQVDDLSYLAEESGWLSGGSMRVVRATRSGGAKTELQNLLTDTYRNARPVMISDGSALYAAFIRADAESGERYAVLTKYDGSSWVTPVRVDNSAILDSAPTLCAHNGTVYLAYSRTTVAPGNSLLTYAQNQQIVVGTVDPDTLAFTEQAVFNGDGFASMPTLFDNNGELTLMWLDADVTDENSVLQPGSGTIRYATLNTSHGVQAAMSAAASVSMESEISTATDLASATDLPVEASSIQINSVPAMGTRGAAAWSETEDLTHVNGAVNSIAPGNYGEQLAVAYVSDGKLFCTTGGTPTLLAEDVTGKVTYATLPGAGQSDFIWNDEGSLHTAGGAVVSAVGITGEYQIVGNNIYYSAASDGGANLTVLQYHNGSGWGVPMKLTGGERYLENLSAAALNGNDYVFGMHTGVTITEDTVTDAKNLVWARVTAVNDLRITGVDYNDEGVAAGDKTPVSITVLNCGDHTVTGVELSVNGTTVETVDTALAPGQETTIEYTVTCPETLTEYVFTVNETDESDYSPENNTESISFGYADVAMEMHHQRIGSSQALVAVVTNQGVGVVDGSVTFYDANGEAVAERTFSSLESGGVAIAECPIDETFAGYRGGDVTAVVTLNQEERYLFNNEANMYLVEKGILLTGTTGQSGSGTATIYEDGEILLQTAITDGAFQFDNVYSGNYTLELRQDGFATDRMTLEVEKGGPAQRELQRHLIAKGNVNGVINAFGNAADTDDMQCLFTYLSTGKNEGQITDNGYFDCVADVNEDGAVNILDYQALYEIVRAIPLEDEEPDANSLVSANLIDPLASWSTYDSLIAQIKSETNNAQRTAKMHLAEDILMATHCVIPIYYYNDIYLQKNYVDGVYSNPYAIKYIMYATMHNGSSTLRANLSSEPYTLDPALSSFVDDACLIANAFSGLYAYDKNGSTVPACAESYTVSPDGITYTVTLKPGLKWSDGSNLTAADFVYSWKRAAADDTGAGYSYLYEKFKGYPNNLAVSAPNSTTLVFELNAPCAYMEDLMAFPTFFPVKQSAVAANPNGWCEDAGFVSNGAYKCTGWDHNNSMTYEKNPYWYDADKVTVNKLELMLSDDEAAMFAAYNAGGLDFTDMIPSNEVAGLIGNPELHTVDELGTYYVSFNAKSALFQGKTYQQAAAMREAFSILIDRKSICENVGKTGQLAANAFVPVGMADGNGGVFHKDNSASEGYYDPYGINNTRDDTLKRARTLLRAAGYKFGSDGKLSSETPIQINYLTNTTAGHIAIAESIRQDLAVLGIEVTVQQQDWNTYLTYRADGNFEMLREGWIADFNDPINMLEMFTTNSANNTCQFGR